MFTTIDTNYKFEFKYYHHDARKENIYDTLYEEYESGYPIFLENCIIEGLSYTYYGNLPYLYCYNNIWKSPWYSKDVKLGKPYEEMGLEDFEERHKKDEAAWTNFSRKLFPKYEFSNPCLSHRPHQLVNNKLHLDRLDSTHIAGNSSQIRLFTHFDINEPRIVGFSYNIPELLQTRLDFNYSSSDEIRDLVETGDLRKIVDYVDKIILRKHYKYDGLPINIFRVPSKTVWIMNGQYIAHNVIYGNLCQCYEAEIEKSFLQEILTSPIEKIKNYEYNFHK